MRPMLKPGLRRVWRDPGTLQFGADPRDATVVQGVTPRIRALLDLLDGSRTVTGVLAAGERRGLSRARTAAVLRLLAEAGLLDDAEATATLLDLPLEARDRLAPDLAALSAVGREPGAGARLLAARRDATVRVRGAGRLGSSLGTLLAAAGVGRVLFADAGRATAADLAPAGLRTSDLGKSRADAARAAVRRMAPEVRATVALGGAPPDLVVLAPAGDPCGLPDPRDGARLAAAGLPHLYLGVTELRGLVGPLVLPGRSSCGRCLALRRSARDPAWPRVLAQLCSRPRSKAPAPGPCEVTLATLTAAVAARQVLGFLDGGAAACIDAQVEVSGEYGLTRRVPLPPEPRCGCGAAGREGTRRQNPGEDNGDE